MIARTYEELTNVYIYLLKGIGLLPYENRPILCKITSWYFHLINFVYYSMHLVDGYWMYVHQNFEIEYIFEIVMIHGWCARFITMYCHRKRIGELFVTCKELWDTLLPDESHVIKNFERKVRFLGCYFYVMTMGACVFYIAISRIVRLPPTTPNGTETRIHPFRFYFYLYEDPWYEIIAGIQDIVCISFVFIVTAIQTIGPVLIMMASGYLKVIQKRLYKISGSAVATNKLSGYDINQYIKFHQEIMILCQRIDTFTKTMFLIQVMCTVYNISLIGFRFLEPDTSSVKYLPILGLHLLESFTCQWIPEHLLQESRKIADAAYSATLMHSEFDSKANRMLLFMMLRAQKPMQMTAGGFINLSLETFVNMFTSAISFFTVLRTTKY